MLLFLLRKTPPPLPATPCASRVLSACRLQLLEHPGGQLGGQPGGQEQEGAWDSMQSSVPSGSEKCEICHCWWFSFSKEGDGDDECDDDDCYKRPF